MNKTKYFTKFNWPRIENPEIRFPLTDANLKDVQEQEEQAIGSEVGFMLSQAREVPRALGVETAAGAIKY